MSKDDWAEDIVEKIIGDNDDKKEGYKHGGHETPQYYCSKCNHAHTKHSKIGQEHHHLRRQ